MKKLNKIQEAKTFKKRLTFMLIGLFTLFFNSINFAQSDSTYLNTAKNLMKKVTDNKLFVSTLTNLKEGALTFPIGIKKVIGGIDYTICLDSLRVTPTGAYLTAYMLFKIPDNGKELAFRATNVPISKSGGIDGTVRLQLIKNFPVKFGAKIDINFLAENQQTYVEWDCNGFKSMSLDAEVLFPTGWLQKEDANGELSSDSTVKGRFTTVVTDWTDLMTTITFDPFRIKGLDGVSFHVQQATFDFSDINTPTNIVFPENYTNNNLLPGDNSLWKGFYLKQLNIKLSEKFNQKSGQRAEIIAQDMLIDKFGFSGKIGGRNIIPIGQGDLAGWKFSLDSIGIEIQANQLTGGGFAGDIVLPVTEDSNALRYRGYIAQGGKYMFVLQPVNSFKTNLWKTNIELYSTSSITIVDSTGFRPVADLTGKLNFDLKISDSASSSTKSKFQLKDINFEHLVIKTTAPYLSISSLSYGSGGQQKLSKFPITVTSLGATSANNEITLDVGLAINFVKGANGFGANGVVSVKSEFTQANGFHKWKYKKLSVGTIGIHVNQGSFSLNGSIRNFNDDPEFGTGFKGDIRATYTLKDTIGIAVSAIFGRTNYGMRYWNTDALVMITPAIPIMSGLQINGFGGGMYYRMKQSKISTSDLGLTPSGISYIPDSNTFIGLKAMLKISTVKKEAFNGDVTFEISFNNGGGLNQISLYGNGYFATPPLVSDVSKLQAKTKKLADLSSDVSTYTGGLVTDRVEEYNTKVAGLEKAGSISAKFFMQYDFTNSTLHATLDAYVNMAGGLLVGVNPGGHAGQAVMHYEPGSWYVHVGKPIPGQYIGIKMLGITTQSYFMVGDFIPPLPPMPANVLAITGAIPRGNSKPQDLALAKGFATGASISLNSAGRWLAFKYSLSAGIGFDLMIRHTPTVSCSNTGNNLRGINGWYAQAQAYAYFNGSVGISVRAFRKNYEFNILSLAAAASLEAKLPNPSWFRGNIAGSYSVLRGMYKGSFSKQVEFGKLCTGFINNNGLTTPDTVDFKVIDKLTPTDSSEVSIFSSVILDINVPVQTPFQTQVTGTSGTSNTYEFKVELASLVVKEKSTGNVILGRSVWDTTKKRVVFTPTYYLNTNTTYTATAKISFKDKASSGHWQPMVVSGIAIEEEISTEFNTNGGEVIINQNNIAYQYPIKNQTNYYSNETNKGYIKLLRQQNYLFKDSNYTYFIRIKKDTSTVDTISNINLDTNMNLISYTFRDSLPTNSILSIEIVKKYKGILAGSMPSATSPTTPVLEIILYKYYFRTSKYRTLSEKLAAFNFTSSWRYPLLNRVHEIGKSGSNTELFDKAELSGISNNPSLIQAEADLDSNTWFNNYMQPLNYSGYPLNGNMYINWRNTSQRGIVPKKSALIRQNDNNFQLTEIELKNKTTRNVSGNAAFVFNTAFYCAYDYNDLRTSVANKLVSNPSSMTPRMNYLLNTQFTAVKRGNYILNFKYVLPGTNEVTSENKINIFNSIN